jgi:hypothetical protein
LDSWDDLAAEHFQWGDFLQVQQDEDYMRKASLYQLTAPIDDLSGALGTLAQANVGYHGLLDLLKWPAELLAVIVQHIQLVTQKVQPIFIANAQTIW